MRPTRNGLDCVIVFLSGVSFRSSAVATKMAEGSERRVRLLRYNNLKGKSGNKSLTQVPDVGPSTPSWKRDDANELRRAKTLNRARRSNQ